MVLILVFIMARVCGREGYVSVSLIRPRGTSLGVCIPITDDDDGDDDSYSDDNGADDDEDDNNEDGFWSPF